MGAYPHRLAEEKVQHVNSMRGDVMERAASSLGRINQPIAMTLLFVKPSVAGQFGEDRLTDHAGIEQLFRALYFGISSAIVGDAESPATFLGDLYHQA